MSWDGEGRRPIRDKQRENRYLRHLMLSILKLSDVHFENISRLPLESRLLDSFLEARRLDGNFKARRRMERHVVNLMRLSTEEEIEALESLSTDPDMAVEERSDELENLRTSLVSGDDRVLSDFIREHNVKEVQQLRQLIRNVKKSKGTGRTAPLRDLDLFLNQFL